GEAERDRAEVRAEARPRREGAAICRLLRGFIASVFKEQGLITLVLLLSSLILQRNSMRWDGKVYEEVPIAHIKATYNNTHIQVVSFDNKPFSRTSCGTEGFQNAKKGTAIAAQTAAMAAAVKARGKGVLHVRVIVKGLGPGRKAAIKGLTMGGLEVISITDNSPVPHNGCRPRKARRL
uniref:Small ribosomal subunit protein uS11m n=2 Tax=Zosterops TaxID=36298 RepID=A0A8D2QSN1_ZOSLA